MYHICHQNSFLALCTVLAADMSGGTETVIATGITSFATCAYTVYTQYPSANGATLGVTSNVGSCYAEFGATTTSSSTAYKSCYLVQGIF